MLKKLLVPVVIVLGNYGHADFRSEWGNRYHSPNVVAKPVEAPAPPVKKNGSSSRDTTNYCQASAYKFNSKGISIVGNEALLDLLKRSEALVMSFQKFLPPSETKRLLSPIQEQVNIAYADLSGGLKYKTETDVARLETALQLLSAKAQDLADTQDPNQKRIGFEALKLHAEVFDYSPNSRGTLKRDHQAAPPEPSLLDLLQSGDKIMQNISSFFGMQDGSELLARPIHQIRTYEISLRTGLVKATDHRIQKSIVQAFVPLEARVKLMASTSDPQQRQVATQFLCWLALFRTVAGQ